MPNRHQNERLLGQHTLYAITELLGWRSSVTIIMVTASKEPLFPVFMALLKTSLLLLIQVLLKYYWTIFANQIDVRLGYLKATNQLVLRTFSHFSNQVISLPVLLLPYSYKLFSEILLNDFCKQNLCPMNVT
jgi:hypothetical protein